MVIGSVPTSLTGPYSAGVRVMGSLGLIPWVRWAPSDSTKGPERIEIPALIRIRILGMLDGATT